MAVVRVLQQGRVADWGSSGRTEGASELPQRAGEREAEAEPESEPDAETELETVELGLGDVEEQAVLLRIYQDERAAKDAEKKRARVCAQDTWFRA